MRSAAAAGGAGAFELVLRAMKLLFNLATQTLNAVTSVEGGADLFVGFNKARELVIEVSVLTFQHVDVSLEGFNFASDIAVALAHALVAEAHIIEIFAGVGKLILAGSDFLVELVQVGSEVPVLEALLVSLPLLLHFLFNLSVELALELSLLGLLAGVLVFGASLLSLGGLEGVACST